MKKITLSLLALLILNGTAMSVSAETVVFNTKTMKYHKPSCQWAQKCTVNCIKIDKKDAVKRGGIPCKVCGG